MKFWLKYFSTWFRTWIHCCIKEFNWTEDHRMCMIQGRNFCNCGYLNNGKSFDQSLEELGLMREHYRSNPHLSEREHRECHEGKKI